MILSALDFDRISSGIGQILLGEKPIKVTLKINHELHRSPDKEYLNFWHNKNFIEFPLNTIPARDDVFVYSQFLLDYFNYEQICHPEEKQMKQVHAKHIADVDDFNVLFDVESFINERLRDMVYEFGSALKQLKDGYVFAGIEDNKIILTNLLNYYKQVRANKQIQISFFTYIFLPKAVSDIMLDILMEIISDKINMMDPEFDYRLMPQIHFPANNFKINWLGTQQEFAELINELKEKNYISFPETEGTQSIARRLSQIFDFSISMRKVNSNIEANLSTVLKTVFNQSLKREVGKIGDTKKFDLIVRNDIKVK